MCCCGKPTINGEPGAYSWDGKVFITRQPDAPELEDGDELLYDGPGRCGGIDSHCHHFRLVKQYGSHYLLVRHGGGDERIKLGGRRPGIDALMEGGDLYWVLQMIYHAVKDAARSATVKEDERWRRAAAEKRIKTRKVRGQDAVKVRII